VSISESAYRFESILTSMEPNADGTLKLTLVVAPDDVNDILLDMKIGGIFMVAAVQLSDDGSVHKPQLMEIGDRAFRSAAALCRNERFQEWLVQNQMSSGQSESEAASAVRKYCGVKSRTELKTSQKAIMKFEKMRSDFRDSIRRGVI
jgi:hypothetical protein